MMLLCYEHEQRPLLTQCKVIQGAKSQLDYKVPFSSVKKNFRWHRNCIDWKLARRLDIFVVFVQFLFFIFYDIFSRTLFTLPRFCCDPLWCIEATHSHCLVLCKFQNGGEISVFYPFTLIHMITDARQKVSVSLCSHRCNVVNLTVECHGSVFKILRFVHWYCLTAFSSTSAFLDIHFR